VAARLLFLFAKEPYPGKVKTRLCPPLTPVQAARCQEAFLEDLLRRMKGVAGARLVLCATPDGAAPRLTGLAAAAGAEMAWQGTGDLGRRMERMLLSARGEGAAGVVLGADSPDLPLACVETAFDHLERPGLVLGPSFDGGSYLVGCRGDVPAIFALGPAWSGPEVFALTLEAVRKLSLEYYQLPPWDDVDDIDGLRRLAARVRSGASASRVGELRSCEALFASLAREGVCL